MKRLVGITTFVTAFLTVAVTWACSPPLIVDLETSEFATPDRIGFALRGDIGPLDTVEFTVTEMGSTTEILGTKTLLEGTQVVTFTPDEPLTVGAKYMVLFGEQVGGIGGPDVFHVEIIDEAPMAAVAETTTVFHQAGLETTCCSTQTNGCEDSCGGECFSCWPGAYEYRPGTNAEVTSGRIAVIVDTFVYEPGNESNEELRTYSRLIQEGTSLDARLRRVSDSGMCSRILIRDLDLNVLVDSAECFGPEAFPEIKHEEPDFPDRVAQCAEPPDNTEDINWVRYGASSKTDGGGCSTASGAGGTGLGLFLFGLAALGRLRRRS